MTQNNIFKINYEPSDEDTIQCFYYAPSLNKLDNINSWNSLCDQINCRIRALSEEYLWHKDEFKVLLLLDRPYVEDFPPHLISVTSFGDNIEDEWFIVYLILELTKENKDLIVQIKDNDGDFLLIEAADYLPSWANPETTENRVFIHNGHIHLIPTNIASLDEKLSLKDAIHIIQTFSDQTLVSTYIEQAILNRVGKYPEKIEANTHNALVKVPVEIAALLKMKPNLIAPIINSYCHHDVIDAKAFKSVSYNNYITISIKFTKCLYAMLLYSKVANSIRQPIEKNKESILGKKIACGLHIIMTNSSDIYSSKEYLKFLTSLKENGYFKNNIEGSSEYKILLKNAKDFFSAVECPIASNVSNDITKIMATDEFLNAKEYFKTNNTATANNAEDNDDWLTIHPEHLNELLNLRYGKKTKFQNGDVITPHTITTELKDFLKQTSDFEGIETNDKGTMQNIIDFDPDQFANCVEKMLKLMSSTNVNEETIESDFTDDCISQSEDDENEIDQELKERLHGTVVSPSDSKTILENMVQSMKEENASIGPTSNLMSRVGFNKTDFLDSDDEQ